MWRAGWARMQRGDRKRPPLQQLYLNSSFLLQSDFPAESSVACELGTNAEGRSEAAFSRSSAQSGGATSAADRDDASATDMWSTQVRMGLRHWQALKEIIKQFEPQQRAQRHLRADRKKACATDMRSTQVVSEKQDQTS